MSVIAPVRMRLSRAHGWRLQEASRAINGLPAVNCARPGKFGNPFTVQRALESGYLRRADDRARRRFVVECFRDWLSGSDKWWMGEESAAARKAVLDWLPSLRDHNLACYCSLDDCCHADILLKLANR